MAMLPNPLPRLADDPAGTTLGLRLPPGTLVYATDTGPSYEPALWYADGPAAPTTWSELRAARSVGLHPVLMTPNDRGRRGPEDWQLAPGQMSYPGDHDPEEVLVSLLTYQPEDDEEDAEDPEDAEEETAGSEDAGTHAASEDADDDELDPDDEFAGGGGVQWAGLAPVPARAPGETPGDPDEVAAQVTARLVTSGELGGPRAALAYARRSADIPAAIGWCGPLNHESDVGRLCAVLRSWEDRFGIRVVAFGYATLAVTVADPPRTQAEAEAVAMEHYAFCPDNISQGTDPQSVYATRLIDADIWHFWWD